MESSTREDDIQESTVKWFDAKKGYGFIDHPKGGEDVFVHYSHIESEQEFKTLRTGQSVAFEMNDGPKGLHALSVQPQDEQEGDGSPNGVADREASTEAAVPREQDPEAEPAPVPAVSSPDVPVSQAPPSPAGETRNRPT